jgi:protein-disulfide isomerase
MKNKFFLFAVLIFGIFLVAFIYFKDKVKNGSEANQNTSAISEPSSPAFSMVPVDNSILIKPHAPIKGAFSAKVTVVEFLDPECESCGAMYPIVKKIYEEYKTEMRLVVRYMAYHQNSKYVANILEGARAENKYWEALELLFKTQGQWANHQNPNPDLIPEILKPLKLNIKKILTDAKAGKYDKQIMEDVEDGNKIGVRGTPTFFVNGNQLQELGYEALKNEIESKLDKK